RSAAEAARFPLAGGSRERRRHVPAGAHLAHHHGEARRARDDAGEARPDRGSHGKRHHRRRRKPDRPCRQDRAAGAPAPVGHRPGNPVVEDARCTGQEIQGKGSVLTLISPAIAQLERRCHRGAYWLMALETINGTLQLTRLTNESAEYVARREELRLAEIALT